MITKRKRKNISGTLIREARRRHKPRLTQLALSRRVVSLGIPITRGGISKIEAGLRKLYDIELVYLAAALKVSPSKLLDKGLCHPQILETILKPLDDHAHDGKN